MVDHKAKSAYRYHEFLQRQQYPAKIMRKVREKPGIFFWTQAIKWKLGENYV